MVVAKSRLAVVRRQVEDNSTLVLLLAYTGLRWGEAVGLRVSNVDFSRRRILLRANAVNVRGTIIPGTPKSHEPRRSVSQIPR